MTAQYLLAGGRQGWDFSGLTRRDLPDGYTEFLRPDGSVQAVVATWLLGDGPAVKKDLAA